MSETTESTESTQTSVSFFDRPNVNRTTIPVSKGVPFGFEKVSNSALGIGGAYGTWGMSYDNLSLPGLVEHRMGAPLDKSDLMSLGDLGFVSRHHTPDMEDNEHLELETQVGARLLRAAAEANGWNIEDVEAVLIGMSGPIATDYVERIARRAGVSESALKVSVHKACDGSVGSLNLAMNPGLGIPGKLNVAEELQGRKVLLGGIEGLSRFTQHSHDKNALQLFGNGAGIIGVVPGESMKFITGKTHENFDEDGVLAVRMYYPHSGERIPGHSLVEISQNGQSIRVAGLMHEPEDGAPIEMAGPMGMVKLFVRTGVQVVADVYEAYQNMMAKLGQPTQIAVAIVHHANYKINKLKEKHLANLGIRFPMPWVMNDFGNVSAASNMIAFLRELPKMRPGQHILFDGFGAGTYYDVLAVALGG